MLLLAAPVYAQSSVASGRAAVAEAHDKTVELRRREESAQQALTRLASEIERLKASRQASSQLQAKLRRSQQLSQEVSSLSSSARAAEREEMQRREALVHAIGEEMERVKAQLLAARADSERRSLFATLQQLRHERDQLSEKQTAPVPALDAAAAADATALRQQADALRDSEDKIRKTINLLAGRISELKQERELERRMGDFLDTESMFDEQDRRLRAARTSSKSSGGAPRATASAPPAPEAAPAMTDPSPAPAPPTAPSPSPSPAPRTDSAFSTPSTLGTSAGVIAKPQGGGVQTGGRVTWQSSSDLKVLERELARLKEEADALHRQANQSEARARSQENMP